MTGPDQSRVFPARAPSADSAWRRAHDHAGVSYTFTPNRTFRERPATVWDGSPAFAAFYPAMPRGADELRARFLQTGSARERRVRSIRGEFRSDRRSKST